MPNLEQESFSNRRLLILAAVDEELSDLRAAATEAPNVSFHAIGCGLVEAAINTGAYLTKCETPPDAVMFIGSAGSYDHSVPLLTAVVCSDVVLADSSIALARGYIPGPMARQYRPDAAYVSFIKAAGGSAEIAKIESGTFASPVAITSDRRLGTIIRVELGARFENLELFSVAAACVKFSIPWCGISVITNHSHQNAHKEWNENRSRASKLTATVILDLLNRITIREEEKNAASSA